MRSLLICPVLMGVVTAPLWSQIVKFEQRRHPVVVESGVQSNFSDREALVFSETISVDGATWLRVNFDEVQLDGDSYVVVRSLLDGESQTLQAGDMEVWGQRSAYFNGSAVTVELWAGPETRENRIAIREVLAGEPSPQRSGDSTRPKAAPRESVCSLTDPREIASPEQARYVGRMLNPWLGGGCTGFLVRCPNATNGIFRHVILSAGHCFPSSDLIQFDVPLSNPTCSMNMPPVSSQFKIITGTVQRSLGFGSDWAVFSLARSGQQTVAQHRGGALTMRSGGATYGSATLVGYGVDGGRNDNTNPVIGAPDSTSANFCGGCLSGNPRAHRNQAAQMHTAWITLVAGDQVRHDISTCAGNSGSPVLINSEVVAIHTNGGCQGADGFTRSNGATNIGNAGLQAAVNFGCRVCDVNGDGLVNTADITAVSQAAGQSVPAGDFRDANRDGVINTQDSRICTMLCTNSFCR